MKTVWASLLLLIVTVPLWGLEEKGGYQVSVGKVTLSRNDTRYFSYYTSRRVNRLQGLKVTVKNSTFREQKEADLEWSILTVKYNSAHREVASGTEKLKSLKAAESTEMVLGSAQIFGWLDSMERTRDKLEWQVVIRREGEEILRTASVPNFDAMARGASGSRPAPARPPSTPSPAAAAAAAPVAPKQ